MTIDDNISCAECHGMIPLDVQPRFRVMNNIPRVFCSTDCADKAFGRYKHAVMQNVVRAHLRKDRDSTV